MLTNAGFVPPFFLELLAHVRFRDISEDGRSIRIPVSQDAASGHLRIFLPAGAFIALSQLLALDTTRSSEKYFLFSEISDITTRTSTLQSAFSREFCEFATFCE